MTPQFLKEETYHNITLPDSAYKDGHLTLAGWLLTVEGCPESFENAFAGRSLLFQKWGKSLLSRWRESGYPCLGDWPPEGVGLQLLDYSLGVISGVHTKSAGV